MFLPYRRICGFSNAGLGTQMPADRRVFTGGYRAKTTIPTMIVWPTSNAQTFSRGALTHTEVDLPSSAAPPGLPIPRASRDRAPRLHNDAALVEDSSGTSPGVSRGGMILGVLPPRRHLA